MQRPCCSDAPCSAVVAAPLLQRHCCAARPCCSAHLLQHPLLQRALVAARPCCSAPLLRPCCSAPLLRPCCSAPLLRPCCALVAARCNKGSRVASRLPPRLRVAREMKLSISRDFASRRCAISRDFAARRGSRPAAVSSAPPRTVGLMDKLAFVVKMKTCFFASSGAARKF